MSNLNLITAFSLKRILLSSAWAVFIFNQYTYAQIPELYGSSATGGPDSLGTIYKINGDGSGFDTVYNFSYATGAEPLVMRMVLYSGKLYGTTALGGLDSVGVIFSFDPSTGAYTDLFDFNNTGGATPYGGLTLAENKFYGATYAGGAHKMGVVYSFDPVSMAYNDIFDFDSVNGNQAAGQLFLASNGNLYGGTIYGGQNNRGVVFSITPPSTFQKILDFDSANGWEVPYGYGLTDGGNGQLYGVTYEGGTHNLGIIYSLGLTNNVYQKVYDFDSIHGSNPSTGLVLAANNILYGTTATGGSGNAGVVYSVNPTGNAFTKVHDFSLINDGTNSVSTLLKASDNKLYGTAYMGGANSHGTIFSFDPATNIFTKIHDCTLVDDQPTGGLTDASLNTAIVAVSNPGPISVTPNPVTDLAVVHFLATSEDNYTLSVSDVTGKVLMFKETEIQGGNQNLGVNLSNFSAGIYFFNLSTNSQHWQTLKVVKQ